MVTIVIPCRNEAGCIRDCLSSVLAQQSPPAGFEVVVADGMSDDGTRQALRMIAGQEPRLRVIDNPQRIVSSGLNAAIKASQGDVIVRMDAHTEYAPDYVVRCVETLESTGADNVGGPWVAKGTGYISRAIAAAFASPFSVGGARSHNSSHEGLVDTVYLGCWHRKSFEQFGYFDEELVRNQDDEYNLRILRGGGRIWQDPRVQSWYHPRGSLVALFCQYAQYGYWKVRVIRKHRLPASWRHVVPGAYLLLLLSCILTSLIWRWAGWAAGFLVGAYALANLAASLHTALKNNIVLLPILPAVFACFHLGYGTGFLAGTWDFLFRRGQAGRSFCALTRGRTRSTPCPRQP